MKNKYRGTHLAFVLLHFHNEYLENFDMSKFGCIMYLKYEESLILYGGIDYVHIHKKYTCIESLISTTGIGNVPRDKLHKYKELLINRGIDDIHIHKKYTCIES